MLVTIVLLMLMGTLLLIAELFVIGGIIGFIGVGLMGLAVFLCFTNYSAIVGFSVLFLSMAITAFTLIAGFYILPRTPFRKGFILEASTSTETGYTSDTYADDGLEGKEGITDSELRPSGIALIDGERIDVVSDGEFIEPQVAIKVIRVDGNRVLVERC